MKNKTTAPAKFFSARTLALNAMLIAVMVVLMTTPAGRIQTPIVSITLAHIPILIAAIVFGLRSGLILALAFGLTSLFIALIAPSSILDPFFVNPLISILPRLLIPVTTFFAYKGFSALMKKWRGGEITAAASAVVIGNLTNTFGVYAMLYLIYARAIFEQTGESAMSLIITAVSTSTLIKCVFVVIITVPVTAVFKKLSKRRLEE